jgi:hypothetical protein
MKKLTGILIVGVASVALFSGCVPITYTKSVQVHKDAQGNITGTTITESITEPHQETKKIQEVPSTPFEYLNKQP